MKSRQSFIVLHPKHREPPQPDWVGFLLILAIMAAIFVGIPGFLFLFGVR